MADRLLQEAGDAERDSRGIGDRAAPRARAVTDRGLGMGAGPAGRRRGCRAVQTRLRGLVARAAGRAAG